MVTGSQSKTHLFDIDSTSFRHPLSTVSRIWGLKKQKHFQCRVNFGMRKFLTRMLGLYNKNPSIFESALEVGVYFLTLDGGRRARAKTGMTAKNAKTHTRTVAIDSL